MFHGIRNKGPHIHFSLNRDEWPPLRMALIDIFQPLTPEGRVIRAGHRRWQDYPIQLCEIKCKLVSVHPNGCMRPPCYFMPYRVVGFDLEDEERELIRLQRESLES